MCRRKKGGIKHGNLNVSVVWTMVAAYGVAASLNISRVYQVTYGGDKAWRTYGDGLDHSMVALNSECCALGKAQTTSGMAVAVNSGDITVASR